MIRNLRRLTAVFSVLSYSLLSAQGICNYSQLASGPDNSTFVEFNSFDCADTIPNAFFTDFEVSVATIGTQCPSWYTFNLEINGVTVEQDLCSISTVDLSTYNVDINAISSLKIVSQNPPGDPAGDNVTLDVLVDITYAILDCPPPSGVNASNINPTTADLNWSQNGTESLWNIEVVNITAGDTATGIADYSGVSTNNLYQIIGLFPETEYKVYVQADCGPFNSTPQSNWSFPETFITPPTCLPLGEISIDSVFDISAGLSWDQVASETAWDIELINISNIPPDTFTYTPTNAGLTTNQPVLTGLTPENNYQFIVRANCGIIDGPSDWTTVYSFTTLPTCQAPIDLTLGNFSNDEATFSWTSIDTEAMWYIEYVNVSVGELPTGIADDSTFTNSYTAQNLDADSEYELYVSAACGGTDGNSYWSGPISVTTLCNPVAMPMTEGFNTWVPECFEVDFGDGEWTPYVSSGDTIAARARNTWGNYAEHRRLLTPMIDIDQAALLTFKWSHDDSNQDTLNVKLSDDDGLTWSTIWSVTGPDFESNDGAGWSTPGTYSTEYLLIDNSYIGSDVIVEFDYASPLNISNDYIFIDSVAVTSLPACNIPYDLTVDSTYTTSVDMSFTVAGTGASLYEIEIVEGIDTITGVATNTATGTPFSVAGLNPGTDYSAYVRTMCGTDSTVWVGPITFTTVCAPVVDYATSFEGLNTGDTMNCWTFIDSTSSTGSRVRVINSAWNAHTGNNSLQFDNGNATSATTFLFASLPEFSSLATQDHRLRFYAKEGTNDGNIAVIGTITDPTDINTFTPIDSIALTNVYTQYTFNFDTYTGSDSHIAIQNIAGSSWADTYIDDLEWHEIPNCFPPTSVVVDSATTNSISISIDSIGTFATEWLIELVDVTGTNPTVLDTAYSTSHTIDGLMASTSYEITISSNCPDAISESTSLITQTNCAPIGSFVNDFEDLNSGDTSICWTYTTAHNITGTWGFPTISVNTSSWSTCQESRSIRMFGGNDLTADILMVTPELMDINAGTHNLTFEATNASNWAPASPFEVGTITDPNDPSTFTSIFSAQVSGTDCDSITVPFLSYSGTDMHIAIKFTPTTTSDNLYIDQIRWEEAPDCATPVGFIIDDLTDIDVNLDWLNASPDTVWYLELVDALDTTDVYDSIPTDTAFAHPYLITGLTENTIYDVYLTNPCDTNTETLQVTFVTPWGKNIGVNEVISPITTGCNTSDSVQIQIEIENFGGQAVTGFPIELSWDDSIYFNVGTYSATLEPYQVDTITIDGYYDFSTAIDTMFYIKTALAGDSALTNDMASSSYTNLGTTWIDLTINTVGSGSQVGFEIIDTLNNVMVVQGGDINGSGNLSSNTTYNLDVCVYPNIGYVMNAYDEGGSGWQGGTYAITRCGGILIANNNGDVVDNGVDSSNWNVWELESQEVFVVEECPDNDLAVISIDSLETSCGLGIEAGYVKIMNFGNLDVPANGATAQYQFNNSGLWIDFWDFDTGLASQTDTSYQLPDIDMSIAGAYEIAVQIVFALDEDNSSNTLSFELNSLPTLTQDSSAFESDNGHWYSVINTGVNDSWERGIPTTTNIGNNNDGKVWATNLTGNAALNESSYLYSPCYDFSDYTAGAEVSFDYVRVGSSHTFRLQRSIDGGDQWFTWSSWSVVPLNNTNDWTNKTLLLPNVNGEPNVIFRWMYASSSWNSAAEGFAFDNWKVKEHEVYEDATLSDLAVNNTTVTDPVNFDPAVLDYTFEVPYGSTNYNVTATANAPFITSIDIEQITSLPDTAFVTVVAEDTAFSQTYSVYITEAAAATDATLQSLSVSNSSVPGFHPDTLCYTITYPFGSTFTPSVAAVQNDPNATFVINNVSIPGTATVVVTAQDGITQNTYCINYEVEEQSSNALLIDLQADLVTVTGFAANVYTYSMELPNGTATPPTVTATADDANATIAYAQAISFPDTAEAIVTAEDGTILTYYVIFTEALSDNADLLDLTINGGTVIGFDAATFNYFVELDYGTQIPTVNVEALAVDTSANIVVVDATGVPGTTVITVTAEDGITVLTYFINWTYSDASSDATLFSMSSDLGGFCVGDLNDMQDSLVVDGSVLNYVLQVGPGSTSLADLLVYPNDANATVTITGDGTEAPYGEIVITVIAQDGFTTIVYTVDVAINCSIGLDETVLGQISVSPNPSNGIFSIETPADLTNYEVAVVDQIGKVIYEEVVVDAAMEKVMDLSTLPSGMYNLRISTANDYIVKRISIIK